MTGGMHGKMEMEASAKNLSRAVSFINQYLETAGCTPKAVMQIELAVEEVFINIANYAYQSGTGSVTVCADVSDDPSMIEIIFIDRGIPYNPLEKEDPDVTLSAEERKIGGLGIFLTKKLMDEVDYVYKDGQNMLTLKKGW